MATLILARKALELGEVKKKFFVFFADTGLEFPEVIQNVKDVVAWAGVGDRFRTKSAGEKFWTLARTFGPPARDFRFCCHTLKASQINDMIDEIVAEEGKEKGTRMLVLLRQRQYRSSRRFT